jgi:RNA polymerase sigma factor (sigma-70 family)
VEASALSHPVGLGRVSLAGPLLRLRTDEQLLTLFRAGHDEAFGTLHDRYRQRLLAYTRQMLGGSQSDAEDVLQDVFLRAYHALRADRRPVALRAWLYRVAHNRCIDQLRRPAPAAEDIYDLNRGVQSDPIVEAERREDLRRLVADVRGLPEQQRSALLMRELEGLPYRELADALGVTVPAIKSLLVRARVGLVEAGEARDTACVEIRDDLAAAFDRGVRASGRSRRHLRECAGCRDYRCALRSVEKQLNGLAPASGPLATLAKLLGLGGAGSSAAAGGTAIVGGGGAAAGGASVGTGVVAATATKVVAVVAAAAVVGGGAATVERVEQHMAHGHKAAAATAPGPSAPVSGLQQRIGASVLGTAATGAAERSSAPTPRIAHLQTSADAVVSSPGSAPYEPTTGGLQAPDDDAATTTGDTDTTTPTAGPGGSGTATAGSGPVAPVADPTATDAGTAGTGIAGAGAAGTDTTDATGTPSPSTTSGSASATDNGNGNGGTVAPAGMGTGPASTQPSTASAR